MNFGIFTKEKNEAKKAEAESADIYSGNRIHFVGIDSQRNE